MGRVCVVSSGLGRGLQLPGWVTPAALGLINPEQGQSSAWHILVPSERQSHILQTVLCSCSHHISQQNDSKEGLV